MASGRFVSVPIYTDRSGRDQSGRDALQRRLDRAIAAAAGADTDAHISAARIANRTRTVRWGAAHGLPRYRCVSCKRTFYHSLYFLRRES